MVGEEESGKIPVSSKIEDALKTESKFASQLDAMERSSDPNDSEKVWLETLEQENAELQLRVSQFREILDSIRDGFFVLDADWRFLYINECAARIGDDKPSDLIGRSIWEVMPNLCRHRSGNALS